VSAHRLPNHFPGGRWLGDFWKRGYPPAASRRANASCDERSEGYLETRLPARAPTVVVGPEGEATRIREGRSMHNAHLLAFNVRGRRSNSGPQGTRWSCSRANVPNVTSHVRTM
jgi:hypothetical protein